MFFIFLYHVASDAEAQPAIDIPKFDLLKVENPFETIIENNFQISTSLAERVFDKENRSLHEFYFCAVEIICCTFENSMGFGRGLNVGYGGAIYLGNSQLQMVSTNFSKNAAYSGGAIAMNDIDALLIDQNNFDENHAFIKGGAIFVTAGKIKLFKQTFLKNQADSNAGAIFAFNCPEFYVEETLFKESKALIQGGAVEVIQSPASFINCEFEQNTAGNYTQYVGYKKSEGTHPNLGIRFVGRASACISAINCPTVVTNECKFLLNEMVYGYLKSIQLNSQGGGLGVNIMLQNCDFWQSTADCFLDNNHYFIYGETKATYQISNTSNKCMPQNIVKNAITDDYAVPKLLTIGEPESVPDPTSFTLAATPLTKLTSNLVSKSYSPLVFSFSPKTPHPTNADIPPNPTEIIVSPVTLAATPVPTRTLDKKETFKVTTTNITTYSTIKTNVTTIIYTYTTTTIRIYINDTIVEISTVTESQSTLSNTIILTNSSVFSETIVFTQTSTIRYILTFLATYIQTESDVIIIINDEQRSGPKLSSSQVIGITTVCLGIACLLAILGLFLYRRNRRAMMDEEETDPNTEELTMQSDIGTVQMLEDEIDLPMEGDEAGTSLDY